MAETPNSERNHLDELNDALDVSVRRMDEQTEANISERRAPTPSEDNEHRDNGMAGERPAGNGGGAEPPVETPPVDVSQQNEGVPGVSNAYGFQAEELNAKPTAKAGAKTSKWSDAPEKKDPKVKAPSGKTIAEMIWNELLSFYEWVIDKSVDLVLDFTVFVLYPSHPNSSGKINDDSKDIFAKGNAQFENWKQEQLKNKELVLAFHDEIFKNLKRQKIGSPLDWKHIGEKPAFFDSLFAIYSEAERNPQSEAAKIMKKMEKFPEQVNKMFKNSAGIGKVAYNYAILQEYMNPSAEKKQEQHINEVAKGHYEAIMTNLNKIRAAYRDNPEEMNNTINRYSTGINDALGELYGNVVPFYENNKSIKKKDKDLLQPKIEAIISAINDFEINVPGENSTKKLSEIAAPENGIVRLPNLFIREGTPENVQQEQRRIGRNDFGNLWREHLQYYENARRS